MKYLEAKALKKEPENKALSGPPEDKSGGLAPKTGGGVNATEKAIELAKGNGIDLQSLEGSGIDGRVTVDDVRDAMKERGLEP